MTQCPIEFNFVTNATFQGENVVKIELLSENCDV